MSENPMIRLDEKGLVPTIAQDANTGEVLMLAYMNPSSLERTLESGDVWFYSRSRGNLWKKGETSGNHLHVQSVTLDCDRDAILLKVIPDGPACHTKNTTCFFTPVEEPPQFEQSLSGPNILEELFCIIQERKKDMPEENYTTKLFQDGVDRICQKVIEEAGETAIAGVQGNNTQLAKEAADLIYHLFVLLSALDAEPEDIWTQLRERRR